MLFSVIAYQIADTIDIRMAKTAIKAPLNYSDSEELFYEPGKDKYVYIFRYGVISFFNYPDTEIASFLSFIAPFCRNIFKEALTEAFMVETDAAVNKLGYNKIELKNIRREAVRMIMLNVSQSVTLDYYSELTGKLLEETNSHTQLLEKKGRLVISGRNLKKFIGKTLLLKNRVAENLYIFDAPPETWEDEELDKLHNELKKSFELQDRFRGVSDGLGIVKENLELFKDLLQYRNSILLEWIVIILIAIEVINFLFEKFL